MGMEGLVLLAAKVIGSALAAVFGLIGTFSDFRTDKGQITRRGKIAIWGLSLSAILTLSAEIWGSVNAQNEAAQAAQRTEKMMIDLDRTLRPLESFGVYVADFSPPRDEPLVADYFRIVDIQIAPVVEGFRSGTYSDNNPPAANFPGSLRAFDKHGMPTRIELPAHFLTPDRQSVLNAVMTINAVHVKVFAAGKSADDIAEGLATPDISIFMWGQNGDEPLPVSYALDDGVFDRKSARLVISGQLLDPGKSQWDSAGTLVAVPDLKGATVTVEFSPVGFGDAAKDAAIKAIRARSVLNKFEFRINSRGIPLDSGTAERQVGPDGEVFWRFQLSEHDPFMPG